MTWEIWWNLPIRLAPANFRNAVCQQLSLSVAEFRSHGVGGRSPNDPGAGITAAKDRPRIRSIAKACVLQNMLPAPDMAWKQFFRRDDAAPGLPGTEEMDLLYIRIAKRMCEQGASTILKGQEALTRITSWNVTSLVRLTTAIGRQKASLINEALTQGPVCLQETHWNEGDVMRMTMAFPMAKIFDSHAILNDAGNGSTGGVAIAIPSNAGIRFGDLRVIIPGFVIQAELLWEEGGCWVTCAYLPPGRQAQMIRRLQLGSCLRPPDDKPHWLVGDFNIDREIKDDRVLEVALEALLSSIGADEVEYSRQHGSMRVSPAGSLGAAGQARRTSEQVTPAPRLIDRVFTTDALVTLGAADCRVVQCPLTARVLHGGHHALTIRRSVRSPCHTASAHTYKAIPWGACTRMRAGVAELALRVNRIPTDGAHPADLLVTAANTLRAWWAAQSSTRKKSAMDPLHDLVREVQKGADMVGITPAALTALEARLGIQHKAVRYPADVGITISKEDAHLLIAAEEQLRAEHVADTLGIPGRSPPRMTRKQARSFARLKKVDSKILAHSGTLYHNGLAVSSPAGLETLYTNDRGPLWTKPPELQHREEAFWLRAYADIADRINIGGLPTIDEIRGAIEASPDTAPGIDGVPYSFWRLIAAWVAPVIQDFFAELAGSSEEGWSRFEPTVQMLIFIPKKPGATTPEHMRPLALPTTLVRVMALVVFRRLDKTVSPFLMQEQALVSNKREAQWNFEKCQHYLDAGIDLQSHIPRLVPANEWRAILLADLNKAFERVDVGWVLRVLAALRTPLWVFNYVAYLSTARFSQFRIGRILGGMLRMARALDMGNSMSPWVFCLSLDPLFRKLREEGRDDRLLGGYVDDTTTGDTSISQVGRAQATISAFANVSGLIVVLHSCAAISVRAANDGDVCLPIECPRAVPQGTTIAPNDKGFTVAGPSWARCAVLAIATAPPGARFLYKEEFLSPELIASWAARGAARHELPPSWNCTCTTKMALVPVRAPTPQEWRELDQQPWGAAIVTEVAVLLGMPLASPEPWHTNKATADKAQAAAAFAKPLAKVTKRHRLLTLTRRSTMSGCTYWSSYIASCPTYVSSYFVPAPELVRRMNAVRTAVTGTKGWLDQDLAPGIFDVLHIASVTDFKIDSQCQLIAAAIRLHGIAFVTSTAPNTRRVREAALALRHAVQTFGSIAQRKWKAAVAESAFGSNRELAKKVVAIVKADFSVKRCLQATVYLTSCSAKRRDLPTDGSEWQKLADVSTADAGHLTRVAVLRWFANKDFDQTKLRPVGPDLPECHVCKETHARMVWPMGRKYPPFCAKHFDCTAPTAPHLWSALVPEAVAPACLGLLSDAWAELPVLVSAAMQDLARTYWQVARDAPDDTPSCALQCEQLDHCPLCGLPGDSIEHIRWWCPVANWALRIFKAEEAPLRWLMPGEVCKRAVLYTIIHQVRLEIFAARPAHRPVPAYDAWIRALGRLVLGIRLGLAPTCVPFPEPPSWLTWSARIGAVHRKRKQPGLPGCDRCTAHAASPGLDSGAPRFKVVPAGSHVQSRRRQIVSIFAQDTPVGQIVAVVPSDAWDNGRWRTSDYTWHVPPERVALPGQANLTWKALHCECGTEWVEMRASQHVFAGTQARIAAATGRIPTGGQLCIQVDGSVLHPGTAHAAAGAGVVAWHLDRISGDTELFTLVCPLLTDSTSMQAEAAASILAVRAIPDAFAAIRALRLTVAGPPLIQADNRIVAQHWQGAARIRKHGLVRRIEDAWTDNIFTGIAPVWEAIPRELNKHADAAAGEASALADFAHTQLDTAVGAPIRRPGRLRPAVTTGAAGLTGQVAGGQPITDLIIGATIKLGGALPNPEGNTEAAANAYGAQSAGAVLLIETPLLTSAAWAIARGNAPGRRDLMAYLLAAAEMHQAGRLGLLALYQCKAPNGQGRAYPLFSAAKFHKEALLALFGLTHTEYDIIGCHLAIFLSVAWRLGLLSRDCTVEHVRKAIADEAGVSLEIAKQATRLFITTDTTGFRKFLLDLGGIWTPPLHDLARTIERAKAGVLLDLHAQGLLGNVPACTERNKFYYACEAAEGRVMRTWMAKIIARCGMVSCILRGDGLWIDSAAPEHIIMSAFGEAAVQSGFPELRARTTDLAAQASKLVAPKAGDFARNAAAGLFAPVSGSALAIDPRPPFLDWLDFPRHVEPARWPAPRLHP